MTRRAPREDPNEDALHVSEPKHTVAGIQAVTKALGMANAQMGVRRTALTLTRVNQKDGFDCPGCAWPDPDHRSHTEFCENGAKAVAEEGDVAQSDAGVRCRPPGQRAAG
jgi:hypothetical protein